MRVEVVSAERELFAGEANEVYARSLDGEIGILPGHQPALLALDIAPVRIKHEGGVEAFAVHHGFLYFRDNHLVVLADVAERAADIDRGRAQASLERARGADDDEARDAARRAEVRVQVAQAG